MAAALSPYDGESARPGLDKVPGSRCGANRTSSGAGETPAPMAKAHECRPHIHSRTERLSDGDVTQQFGRWWARAVKCGAGV